jgi:uncharacterized repeat protein (TIGR01451 family)
MKTKIATLIITAALALILCSAVSAANDTGLADTPKATLQYDNNHTGQSNYTGPQTNNKIWNNTTGIIGTSGPVIGSDGTIYIGCKDGKFYAVNPDGTLKWTYSTGGTIASTAAIGTDGTIYIGSADYNLYALIDNGTSAIKKWNYTTNGIIGYSSPTIGADGTIYIGSYDCNLYAINPNGTLKWNYTASDRILCSAAIGADGTIYIGSNDRNIYAFNPNGTPKWIYNTTAIVSSISIGQNGTLYVGTSNGLHAITDKGTNASLKWIYNPGTIQGYPAIGSDGTIYVGCGSKYYAVTDNRDSYTTTDLPGGGSILLYSPTIGADGTIYLARNNGVVQAVRNGVQIWTTTITGGRISGGAAISTDGTLYIGIDYFTIRGGLYAFKDVPVANFTADITNGNTSQAIQFTDNSTGNPASWAWDFGDGTTSTEQNPTHTYAKSGTYTVKLTVTNAAGSSEKTIADYITIVDTTAPVPSANPAGGPYNTTQTVNLTATDNEDPNPKIYYTLDGSIPTTSSTLYTGPITIANTTTLKFIAVDEASNTSPVHNETYNIKSEIYVNITSSNPNPQVGDKVTYTFKLGNKGPGIAKDVVFTYIIPEGLEYAGANVDQGVISYNETTRTLTWTLGDVVVGDPYLWLDLNVLSAGSFNIKPIVTVSGYNPNLENNIGSLLVNVVSASTNDMITVNAASETSTVPMQATGMPFAGLIMALLMVGSGLALGKRK